MAGFSYKSLKSWKIDNIDLTQQVSLSIFTDFRYQSIKITWLLLIFIDTDFYRLTTSGHIISLSKNENMFKKSKTKQNKTKQNDQKITPDLRSVKSTRKYIYYTTTWEISAIWLA